MDSLRGEFEKQSEKLKSIIQSCKVSQLRSFISKNKTFSIFDYLDKKTGNTLLHEIILEGSYLQLMTILKTKNDVPSNWMDKKNNEGYTALHYAVMSSNYVDLVPLLIENDRAARYPKCRF